MSFIDTRLKYIYRNRQVLLPWVDDWTDPQNHIRNVRKKSEIKKIPWIDLFWCHPDYYVLMYYSLYISGFFTSVIMGTISYFFWSKTLSVIFTIIALIFGGVGMYKRKDYKLFYGKTFYDVQMRDY